jgi:hypothetical protein
VFCLLLATSNYVSVGRRQKTALLGLFSASFPHPVQGVSPAALNEPGSQVYGHLALAPHHSLFCRASPPVPKKAHWLLFCSLKAQTGSLRILAASRILFKGRVHPLSVEDDSPQHLSSPGESILPCPQCNVCPPLQPSLLLRVALFLHLPSSPVDHSPVPPHLDIQ